MDSLWVTPFEGLESTDLATLTDRVTEAIGVPLEREAAYDWLCFVPERDSQACALNRYFGTVASANADGEREYKLRGTEARQRSTPPFVEHRPARPPRRGGPLSEASAGL